ncbi:MAG: hypothetical protein IT562_16485 [Alphaproteobacteria bacterium]|nr:hypothetical protein [Alphaproteobacteria bacterium]
MWRARLAAGLIVAILALVGAGFLVAAGYMALLELRLSASIAALLVGSALLGIAATALLIAMLLGRAPASNPLPAPAIGTGPHQPLPDDLDAPEMLAQQIGTVLRNLNPATIALLGAGLLMGLLRRR